MASRNGKRRLKKQARRSKRSSFASPPHRSQSDTRGRALQVKGDILHNPNLTFTQAAKNRGIDPRTVRKHLGPQFYKDSSGRVRARSSDRLRQTLHIPSDNPGVSIPVPTKNRPERLALGTWLNALNAAGRGDFSKIRKLPSNQVVGGVLLPTKNREVQAILEALAEEESPFEGLYRSLTRPS